MSHIIQSTSDTLFTMVSPPGSSYSIDTPHRCLMCEWLKDDARELRKRLDTQSQATQKWHHLAEITQAGTHPQIEDLSHRIKSLETAIEKEKAFSQEQLQKITELQIKISESSQRIHELELTPTEGSIEWHQVERKSLTSQVESLTLENQQLRQQLQELSRISSELSQSQERIQSLEGQLKGAKHLADIRVKFAQGATERIDRAAKRTIEELEKRVEESEEARDSLRETLVQSIHAPSEYQRLEQRIKELEAENARLREQKQ